MSGPPAAEERTIPELTAGRLSLYLRCLEALEQQGIEQVSSRVLAEHLNLNAAQIRKDLAHFGEFGIRGVGYRVGDLRHHLRAILGLDRSLKVVIVGAGNLGLALADYPGFRKDGFHIVALLDVAADKVGRTSRGGVPILHVSQLTALVRQHSVAIAITAVPPGPAQEVVDQIVSSGIGAILNFSSAPVRVPAHVRLRHADLSVSLETLSFLLAQR
jgi:redox-sensing transcriptional repressor